MDTEKTETDIVTETNEGEGEVETISIPKTEWEKHNQTLGSLKRELKDLKKAKEETKETPITNTKPDENPLEQKLEKLALRQAGITDPEDIELARKTAKKWNMDIDDVLSDDDFKVKLEKQQTARANVQATSGVRGSGTGTSQAKNTPEYWQAKGVPPTPADVPDGKTRRAIVRSMLSDAKKGTGSKFYNEQRFSCGLTN